MLRTLDVVPSLLSVYCRTSSALNLNMRSLEMAPKPEMLRMREFKSWRGSRIGSGPKTHTPNFKLQVTMRH